MIEDRPHRVCAATSCTGPVEARYLFCPRHRQALPPAQLRAIREACDPGKGRGGRISPGWLEAVADAVELLALAEGRPTGNRYRLAAMMSKEPPELSWIGPIDPD